MKAQTRGRLIVAGICMPIGIWAMVHQNEGPRSEASLTEKLLAAPTHEHVVRKGETLFSYARCEGIPARYARAYAQFVVDYNTKYNQHKTRFDWPANGITAGDTLILPDVGKPKDYDAPDTYVGCERPHR